MALLLPIHVLLFDSGSRLVEIGNNKVHWKISEENGQRRDLFDRWVFKFESLGKAPGMFVL